MYHFSRQYVLPRSWHRVINVIAVFALVIQTFAPGLALMPVEKAQAADTGYSSPAATGGNHNDWSNPSNAFSSNDVYATETTEDQDQSYENFGFSVPANATIDGIEVKVEAKSSDTSGCRLETRLWSVSDNAHGTYINQNLTGTDAVYTLGGATNTWGATWIGSDFTNGNFHLEFQFDDVSSNNCADGTTASVDHVQAKVFYTVNLVVTDARVDGSSSTTVLPGAAVDLSVDVTTEGADQNNDWESTRYRIGGGSWACEDTTDHTNSGSFSETFGISAPGAVGTYDVDVVAYNNDSCTSSIKSDTFTLNDAITVQERQITPNPELAQACGLDLALVIDSSGSISDTELTQMKNAYKAFVDAFLPGTPTEMSVVEYDTNVVGPTLAFTDSIVNIKNDIDAASSGGYTNWEAGLYASHNTYDPRPAKPDLMLFASDGNANTTGVDGNSNGGDAGETLAMNAAVTRANAIKSDGIRILALGIGNDLDLDNLKAISGPNVNTGVTSDVITSSFDTLAATLAQLADDLCGGKILVQKKFDTDGDGQADLDGSVADPLLAGYTFDVDGSPSDPGAQTTDNTGSLEFSVLNGTYSVAETLTPNDTELVSAICLKGTAPVGTFDPQTGTISGLSLTTDETISCNFVNRMQEGTLTVVKNVVGGSAVPGDWQIHVQQQGNEVTGSPQAGTSTGTDYTLISGSYNVFESDGPQGYTLSYGGDCNVDGYVTVPSSGNATCTLTNTRDVGRVKIVKVLDDQSNPTAWTFDVTGFGTMNHDQYETLDTGSYPVTELGPDGYTLDHVSGICDTVDGETFQLHVTANGGTCTVYNTLNHGSLTVTKVVDSGSALPEEFGFRIGDGSYTYPASGQSTVMFDDLTPGTYSVTETGPAGYHQVSTTCEGVSVAPDQDATCEIHNARDTGTVTINKYFDDNGDGQVDRTNPEGWTWDVTGGPQDTPGGQSQVLETGNYTVTEDAIPGYATNWYCLDNKTGGDGTSIPVPLPNHGDQLTCAFVNNRILGSVEVCKKIDVNGDGDVSGDPYYTAGWDMTLDDSVTQTTGENGCTTFGLVPGDHSVMEASKDGWVRTYPADSNTQNVSVAADQTANVVFGNAELGDIHGYKWNDLNGNGVRDCITDATTATTEGELVPCEPLLSGWTIKLWKGAELVGTTMTDDGAEFGWYHFGNLVPGTYTVCEEGQPGWAQMFPVTANDCHTIELESNEEAQAYFGNQPGMSKITGTKYYDWDHTGDLTVGDTTLGGWTIQLKSGDTVLDSTETAPNGTYSLPVLDGLTPGWYDVCEVLQTNWSTENVLCQAVYVDGEHDFTGVDFFNHQNDFAIHGQKFNDLNGNGVRDCTYPDVAPLATPQGIEPNCEPFLSGWTVFLDVNGNSQLDQDELWTETSSDPDPAHYGWYAFEDLMPGTYRVCEVQQAGWDQTSPVTADGCHEVELPYDGETTESGCFLQEVSNTILFDPQSPAPTCNFGNTALSTVTGFKWEDLNGNGQYDCEILEDQAALQSTEGVNCEPRLDNWTITIQKLGDDFSDTTLTSEGGWYQFDELMPGAYLVCEEQQDGWTQSYPSQNEGCHVVFVNGDGGRYGEFNFGNYTGGTVFGTKWEDMDDDGDPIEGGTGLPGWTINLWTSCSADFTDYDLVPSGQIDGSDFSAYAAALGSNDPAGDFNADGVVDQHDTTCFTEWMGNSNADPAPATGPYALAQSTVTDVDGNYAFTNVQPGSYYISETQQAGWTQTYPATLGIHGPVTVESHGAYGSYDFGNYADASIAGMKWSDLNEDGVKDVTEVGLEGWTINLYSDMDGEVGVLLASTTTAADGSYAFTGLMAGTYWVNETSQVDWTQTFPGGNGFHGPVEIVSGTVATGYDFGNHEFIPEIPVPLEPTLTIVKSVDDTLVGPDDQVTYTVVVSNVGDGAAVNVVLRDTQESGLTLDSTGTTTNEWDLGDIASGDSMTVTYTATVNTDAANGDYTNVAEAQADNNGPVQDDASVTVRRPGEVLGEESLPELAIEKSVNVDFANPGATVTYTVVVANNGDALAENVVLRDTLEAGLTFAANGTATQTWDLGDLPSGTSVEVHYDVTVAKTTAAGIYANVAVADADNADPVSDTVDLDVRLGAVLGAEDLPRSGGDRAALVLLLMGFVLMAGVVAVTTKRSQA